MRLNRFAFLLLVGSLFSAFRVCGQEILDKDSLLRLLPAAKDDSNKALLYISIGQQYESSEPEKAKQYYLQTKVLSEKIGWPAGFIKYASNYTYVLNMQGLFDSGLIINQQAVAVARRLDEPMLLAKALFNLGTSYRMSGAFEKAVVSYEEGKKIFERVGDDRTEAQLDDILQSLYTQLQQYQKGVEYGERAVVLSRKADNPLWLGSALTNLGVNYSLLKQHDKSLPLFMESLDISRKIGDKNMECAQYLNIGEIYLARMDYTGAKPWGEKALTLSRELELHESESIANRSLSIVYLHGRDYPRALDYGQDALRIALQYHMDIQRQKILGHLALVAYAMQDTRRGAAYEKAADALGDTLLSETIRKNSMDLEKKYETEKKEVRIVQLEDEKKLQQLTIRHQHTLNYILIGGAVFLLALFGLSYRNYQQKQKLHHQRIQELETEKKLEATEAVLKGEEQERARLAKDLHDGLGGMLSGMKYSFNTMKGNLIMTPENQQAFDRSMDMLDSSIKEMRRVAHNMMPEALVKFGLDVALKDYCNDINSSGALHVSYQSYGLEQAEIDQTTAITLYRIVQELVNNALKHAAAKTAIVQVTKTEQTISVTVEDDGKGFDPAVLDRSRGIGWSNIRNRVEFLKGKLDIRSEADKGTSVHIEINNV